MCGGCGLAGTFGCVYEGQEWYAAFAPPLSWPGLPVQGDGGRVAAAPAQQQPSQLQGQAQGKVVREESPDPWFPKR